MSSVSETPSMLTFRPLKDDKTRPKFRLEPCKCRICYFCKTKVTHGVTHKRISATSLRKTSRTQNCSGERVNLQFKGSAYCKLCYKLEKEADPKAKSTVIRSRCNTTRLGCETCNTPICKECWPKFEHDIY